MQVNKSVRVKSGNMAGAVGSVEAINAEKKTAQVHIAGIFDSKPVDVLRWFKMDQPEAIQ